MILLSIVWGGGAVHGFFVVVMLFPRHNIGSIHRYRTPAAKAPLVVVAVATRSHFSTYLKTKILPPVSMHVKVYLASFASPIRLSRLTNSPHPFASFASQIRLIRLIRLTPSPHRHYSILSRHTVASSAPFPAPGSYL